MSEVLEISHSEIATFRSCRRRWFISYFLCLLPDPARASPTGAAQLGTRVHMSLQGLYSGLDPIRVLEWDYADAISSRPDYAEELEKEQALATIMVEGYIEWAQEEGVDAGIDVVSCEHEEKARITTADGDEVVLRGKFDQLVRRRIDDVLLARDFKTTATFQKIDSLILGTQLRHYSLMQALNAKERGEGERVEAGDFIMLRRVKRTASAKPPFYSKVSVHLNKHDWNSWYLACREICGEIVRTRRRLENGEDHRAVVYAGPSDACSWICHAKVQCPLFDDGSRYLDALKANFTVQDPYARYSDNRFEQMKKSLKPRINE